MVIHKTKISVLILILVALITTGCTINQTTNKESASSTPTVSATPTELATATSSPTASPSTSPKIQRSASPKAVLMDCTGPDGKTIKLTQKACEDFNKSWVTSTATPAPAAAQVTGCGAYNPTGSLGTARVSVKLESGQSWVGQGVLKFSQKHSECKGNGLDYVWQDIITGPITRDFGGLRPGPYKVEVMYLNKNWSSDVNLNGGTSDVTVTVSNN